MFSVEQIKQLNDLEREVYQAILQQKEAVLYFCRISDRKAALQQYDQPWHLSGSKGDAGK